MSQFHFLRANELFRSLRRDDERQASPVHRWLVKNSNGITWPPSYPSRPYSFAAGCNR